MEYGYKVYPVNRSGDILWIAESDARALGGPIRTIHGEGLSPEAAVVDLEEVENKWVEISSRAGIKINAPKMKKVVAPAKLALRDIGMLPLMLMVMAGWLFAFTHLTDDLARNEFLALLMVAAVTFTIVFLKFIDSRYTCLAYVSDNDKYIRIANEFEAELESQKPEER